MRRGAYAVARQDREIFEVAMYASEVETGKLPVRASKHAIVEYTAPCRPDEGIKL